MPREDFIFYDLVTTKGFQVHIDIPERNIYALGNVEVLGRVLNNLISNAITYGDDGKALGMTLRDDDTGVYIDVWDKGKGIDESHIDKVFERMYTLEDSRNRLYQGSGLGLTITKRLVEAMDGKSIFLVNRMKNNFYNCINKDTVLACRAVDSTSFFQRKEFVRNG